MLSKPEAMHCVKIFKDYFGKFERIDEYMRDQKLNSLIEMPMNPLFPLEDELFSDFKMHPKDMKIEVVQSNPEEWEQLLNITSSHVNIAPVGRNLKLSVKEKNTNKFLGFIRLGSPVINCKPRNDLLGQVFSQNKDTSDRFNKSTMMGFVIVPAQPFGFNYLGGKLLASICCSHEVRELVNKKYKMNMCLFETTSLYGSTKSSSQYDGMKPYLRYQGLTDSDFLPMMHGKPFHDLRNFVEMRLGPLVPEGVSSQKLKQTTKIISLIKSTLKGSKEIEEFNEIIEKAKNLTEQKRYYTCNYGFKNYLDYINCKTDTLIPDENYERFKLENVVEWWKNKATNRYETLKTEKRLRKKLEVWTSKKRIDIIR